LKTEKEKKQFLLTQHSQTTIQLKQTSNQKPQPQTQEKPNQSFQSFLKNNSSNYLATIALATASMTAVFLLQDNLLRALSGLLLTIVLPGYALMKVVFPPKTVEFEKQSGTGWLFMGSFSVVMSIVVVSMVTFALDLTPFGITVMSLNLSLFSFTLIFGALALWRRYSGTKNAA